MFKNTLKLCLIVFLFTPLSKPHAQQRSIDVDTIHVLGNSSTGEVGGMTAGGTPLSTIKAQAAAAATATALSAEAAIARAAETATAVAAAAAQTTANGALTSSAIPAAAGQLLGGSGTAGNAVGITLDSSLALNGFSLSVKDISSAIYTATGGTAGLTPAQRAAQFVNVRDYGRVGMCDGTTTDDTSAFNAAITVLRSRLFIGGALTIGTLIFPGGECSINGSIDLHGFSYQNVIIHADGTTLNGFGGTNVIVDARGSGGMSIYDLTIRGDSTSPPLVGLAVGRINQDTTDSTGHMKIYNLRTYGSFTDSGTYNGAAETTLWSAPRWENANTSTTAVAYRADGINYSQIPSAFFTGTMPHLVRESFTQNTYIDANIRRTGGAGPVMWMANSGQHIFINSYLAQVTAAPGVVLYSNSSSDANSMLTLDLHGETSVLTSMILLSGPNTSPVLSMFNYNDRYPGPTPVSGSTPSVIKADTGITNVSLPGSQITINAIPTGTVMFDQPSIYSGYGIVFINSSGWNLPASQWNGPTFTGGSVNGTFSNLGYGLTLSNTGVLSWAPTNPVPISQIAVSGSVGTLTLGGTTGDYGGAVVGVMPFPQIKFGTPSGTNGVPAVAHVTTMSLHSGTGSGGKINGGSGYVQNDLLAFADGNCTVPPVLKAGTVDGNGGVLTLTTVTAGTCQTLPSMPATLVTTTGTGSGVVWQHFGWKISGISLDGGGSGYANITEATPTAPGTSQTPVSIYAGSVVQNFVVTVTSQFSATAGSGSIVLDNGGTELGVAGTSGSPVNMLGAVIDTTMTFTTPTSGATVTAPANTASIELRGTTPLSSLSLLLPPIVGTGGQEFKIGSQMAITTLSVKTSSGALVASGGQTSINANGGLAYINDGTTWYLRGSLFPATNATAAAGTTQAAATSITTPFTTITSVPANGNGFALPTAVAGASYTVTLPYATGTNYAKIYPVNSGTDLILPLAANTAFPILPGETLTFTCFTTGTWTQNAPSRRIINISGNQATHTGDTVDTVLVTGTIPANIMGPNGVATVRFLGTRSAGTGTVQFRVKWGAAATTMYASTASSTNITTQQVVYVHNANSTTAQIAAPSGLGSFGVSTAAPQAGVQNTTAEFPVVVSGLLGTTTDTVAVDNWSITVEYAP